MLASPFCVRGRVGVQICGDFERMPLARRVIARTFGCGPALAPGISAVRYRDVRLARIVAPAI